MYKPLYLPTTNVPLTEAYGLQSTANTELLDISVIVVGISFK